MKIEYPVLLSLLVLISSGCSDSDGQATAPNNSAVSGEMSAVKIIDGLDRPVFLCSPARDFDRLFVIEKVGKIRILRDTTLAPVPYLDIRGRVGSAGSEQGLLGMAFHPDYEANGLFFVNYTDQSGNTVISRFSVSGDPNIADQSSEQLILSVGQPFSNHNAGMLAFSPVDGYLYIGLGDGGSAGDPQNFAQNPLSLLGKMLRIDVNGTSPYVVPDGNPYKGNADTLGEIWSFGLRNPWRYSFDKLTGDMYIGDVGQGRIEEIDFMPATSTGRENYGWRLKEGSDCFNPSQGCDTVGAFQNPIVEYSHSDPSAPCSVTGGYVYRGSAIPELSGVYLYGDYCSGQIWSLKYDGTTVTGFREIASELGLTSMLISSFGEDAGGELYIIDYAGSIYRLII